MILFVITALLVRLVFQFSFELGEHVDFYFGDLAFVIKIILIDVVLKIDALVLPQLKKLDLLPFFAHLFFCLLELLRVLLNRVQILVVLVVAAIVVRVVIFVVYKSVQDLLFQCICSFVRFFSVLIF